MTRPDRRCLLRSGPIPAERIAAVRIVLASASPRRRELLERLGRPFEVRPADREESARPGQGPVRAIRRIARLKAASVAAADRSPGLVIGADTAVVLGKRILGKPAGARDARSMLAQLRGRTHQVVTALAVIENPSGTTAVSHTVTAVTMRPYSDREATAYIASGESEGKAGAYAIQGSGGRLVDAVQGCYLNVVGLPLCELQRMLAAAGLQVPSRCTLPDGRACPASADVPGERGQQNDAND